LPLRTAASRTSRYHPQVAGIPIPSRCSRHLGRCLAAAAVALAGIVLADQPVHHALSYDLVAEASYAKRLRVEVGDVPQHVLEVYSRSRVFARQPPLFDGVRAAESREQGVFDLVDQSGTESGYVTFVLEDGSRVLGRYNGILAARRWPDGSRHYDVRGTLELTGGTGRFAKIRGQLRIWQALDPGADSSQGQAEGQYWLEP
jgi:hypothetical protein